MFINFPYEMRYKISNSYPPLFLKSQRPGSFLNCFFIEDKSQIGSRSLSSLQFPQLNEIPIENFNLNELNLNCSNDMKSFINESLENFKLQQLKEKMNKINDSNFLYLNTNNNDKSIDIKNNNNMNGFIRLDYDDEIKDKSNILEPIELDKSNFNLNFRKSFVESISGIKN